MRCSIIGLLVVITEKADVTELGETMCLYGKISKCLDLPIASLVIDALAVVAQSWLLGVALCNIPERVHCPRTRALYLAWSRWTGRNEMVCRALEIH